MSEDRVFPDNDRDWTPPAWGVPRRQSPRATFDDLMHRAGLRPGLFDVGDDDQRETRPDVDEGVPDGRD